MDQIFEPETHTQFSWDHWGKLRGRKTYVFAYDVQQEYSKYRVEADDDKLTIVPAYRGLVSIDEDTKMVVKIVMTPYDMPSTFPIREINSSLDYDLETRNDIEFRLYRKFGTESTIKFETPDALPEDQTKEKPAEDKPQK
jgi:archaellin